jgi:6-phosphogluconolactonase
MSTVSRRTFLRAAALATGAAMLPWAASARNKIHWVFVGTFTNASGEDVPTDFGTRGPDSISRGLYSFAFDEKSGKAGPVQLAAEITNPGNLIMHSNKKFLYACRGQNSVIDGQSPVTGFAVKEDGTLRELNTVPSGGRGATVGTVDKSGRNLLTTNFSSNSIVCIRLNEDGTLGERTSLIGQGPTLPGAESGRQGQAQPGGAGTGDNLAAGAPGTVVSAEMVASGNTKPHAVVLSRSEQFAIAAEIHSNRCHVMRFDSNKGSLETHAYAKAGDHCGPRHLMFHPSYRWLYTSDEEGSFVSAWRWDEEKGSLEHFQQLTTLPDGFNGAANHPADIVVHPGGKFVYVSNRSTGTIAGYGISQKDGSLTPIGQTTMGSPSSWGFIFDGTGKWAIVSEQIGDAVRIYSVNQDTGKFTYTGQELKVVLPICVRIA